MKKNSLLFFILLMSSMCMTNCNKTKKMKDILFPDQSYEKANVDIFYWSSEGWDYSVVPLIKPYKMQQLQDLRNWMMETYIATPKIETFHNKNIVLNSFDPIEKFNVSGKFIYGYKGEKLDFDEKDKIPRIWFLINIETKEVTGFESESDFKTELKKLNLPEELLSPDVVYGQYKNDPVLPWFPDDVKKQLEEVKAKK